MRLQEILAAELDVLKRSKSIKRDNWAVTRVALIAQFGLGVAVYSAGLMCLSRFTDTIIHPVEPVNVMFCLMGVMSAALPVFGFYLSFRGAASLQGKPMAKCPFLFSAILSLFVAHSLLLLYVFELVSGGP